MKLSTNIAVVLLVVAIAAGVTVSRLTYLSVTSPLRESIAAQQSELARETMRLIDQTLFGAYKNIQVIARDQEFADFLKTDSATVPETIVRRLRDERDLSGPWNVLFVADNDGQIRAASSRTLVGSSVDDDPEHRLAFDGVVDATIYHSDLVYVAKTGDLTVVFAAPIFDRRRHQLGTLIGHFAWPYVLEILEEVRGPRMTLYNGKGIVIGISDPDFRYWILQMDGSGEPAVRRALQGPSATRSLPSVVHREKSVVSYLPQRGAVSYKGNGWILSAETKVEEALASARRAAVRQAVPHALTLLIGFAITLVLLIRQVSRPLSRLTMVAKEIADGDLSKRAQELSHNEVGQLAHAFNEMTDQLTTLTAELEQRVVDRTEEVKQRAADLERANAELENAVAELQRSNASLDEFAYVASHDLRSPLRGIDNLARWVLADEDNTLSVKSREDLEKLRERVGRMNSLLEGLLQYSRIGRKQYGVEAVDTGEVVRKVADLVHCPEPFSIQVAANMPLVRTQRIPLEQVLRNLIDNAIKHHDRADGVVSVSAKHNGQFLEFTVTDDGPGIPRNFHERAFGIFETMNARNDVEASGMGLALVKKTVETHGGKITLDSHEGKGTVFRFTWRTET